MKTGTIGVVIALSFYAASYSQIAISTADMPAAGDTIRVSVAVNAGGIDFSLTGENYFWDFSGLIPLVQRVDEYVGMSATPWIYQFAFMGAANLARPMEELEQVPGIQITDAYEFYNNTSSTYRFAGYAATISGVPFPLKYNDPDVIYRFPLLYGNEDSSFAQYGYPVPGIGYLGGWKKRVNKADGWGTVKTPYGEFDALRIRSHVLQYDSLYLDTAGTGYPLMREYTEFKWLGNDFGIPLLTFVDETINPTITYIDSVRNLITGITPGIAEQKRLRVYPNPSHGTINLHIPPEAAGVDIEIELTGLADNKRIILFNGKQTGGDIREFNLRNLHVSPGVYILTLRAGKTCFREKVVLF